MTQQLSLSEEHIIEPWGKWVIPGVSDFTVYTEEAPSTTPDAKIAVTPPPVTPIPKKDKYESLQGRTIPIGDAAEISKTIPGNAIVVEPNGTFRIVKLNSKYVRINCDELICAYGECHYARDMLPRGVKSTNTKIYWKAPIPPPPRKGL